MVGHGWCDPSRAGALFSLCAVCHVRQLLFWVAIPIILFRLFVMAPYLIAKADAETIDRQQKEIKSLKDKLTSKLVITGIVDETEPAQANYWLTTPANRTVKVEVKNIGAEILKECLEPISKLNL
jgi:hypothetical protein